MTTNGKSLLFVQGGGDDAHQWDKDIVERLQEALGKTPRIKFPKIDGLETLEWTRTQRELRAAVKDLSGRSVIVAHSVGASAMLKLLVEGADISLKHLFLLAPPYEGADGEWGEGDFSIPADFAKRVRKLGRLVVAHVNSDHPPKRGKATWASAFILARWTSDSDSPWHEPISR